MPFSSSLRSLRRFLLPAVALGVPLLSAMGRRPATPPPPPNVVIIYADDLGYGDLGCYGSPTIRTPALDRMAAEGMRFTDFYSAGEVCTPSRAALLTGRYPVRSGMAGGRRVLFPESAGGLPPEEVTFAEALRERGYLTAHIGKWHLGVHAGSRPNDQGFELSVGLPYSNDMDARPGLPRGAAASPTPPPDGWNVPLLRNGVVEEQPVDQTTLTDRYTREALRVIDGAAGRPFLIYLAHTFPHVPLFASTAFRGRSRAGIYGDTVEELDDSVGRILRHLREKGLAENTLVIFSSDNGPWLTQGAQGGSAGPLRDGKGSTWEGGMRVPAIAWWPGRVQPSVCSAVASTLDVFPTLLALARVPVPGGLELDGRDASPLLFQTGARSDLPFLFFRGQELMAVRLNEWKLHFQTQAGYGGSPRERHDPPLLFHLGQDPGERRNVASEHSERVQELRARAERMQAEVVAVPSRLR
jgi:arylsulfatase A